MDKINELLLVGMVLFGLANEPAPSQPTMTIRGAITGLAGHELQVKTHKGRDLKVNIAGNTKINVLSPLKISDIKKGSFVGVTAIRKGPGTRLQAREVHLFQEARRGTGEGHRDWDLEPGASMTRANVDAIANTNNGKELTLSYKGGRQKIIVPQGVPVVTFKSAARSLLKTGAQVFITTQHGADGSLTARSISVGRNGMTQPM